MTTTTEFTAIQQRELNKAIQILQITGVSFALLMPTGEKIGNLEIAKPKLVKPPPKFRKLHKWNHLDIGSKLTKAKLGDVLVFPIPVSAIDPNVASKLQGAISGAVHRVLGPGNATSMINREKGQVEVLITGIKAAEAA